MQRAQFCISTLRLIASRPTSISLGCWPKRCLLPRVSTKRLSVMSAPCSMAHKTWSCCAKKASPCKCWVAPHRPSRCSAPPSQLIRLAWQRTSIWAMRCKTSVTFPQPLPPIRRPWHSTPTTLPPSIRWAVPTRHKASPIWQNNVIAGCWPAIRSTLMPGSISAAFCRPK